MLMMMQECAYNNKKKKKMHFKDQKHTDNIIYRYSLPYATDDPGSIPKQLIPQLASCQH